MCYIHNKDIYLILCHSLFVCILSIFLNAHILIFSEIGKAKELSRVGFNIEEWRERRDQACPECEATPYQKMDGFWYVGTIRTGTVTHARGKTLRETLEQIGLGLRFVGLYREAI